MIKMKKKLGVSRESLLALQPARLQAVVGGSYLLKVSTNGCVCPGTNTHTACGGGACH